MFATVLVMLSLDDRDDAVVDAVIAGAAGLGCLRIVVAHVFNEDPLHSPLSELLQQQDHTLPPQLGEVVDRLSRALPDVDVQSTSATGTPEAEIARIVDSHQVDLMALGRRAAADGKPGWGASGSKLLRLAPCSVLIVPVGAKLTLDRAVAGLDFSPNGIRALSVASRLCSRVCAVYHFQIPRSRVGGKTSAQWQGQVLDSARAHLDRDVLPKLPAGSEPELVVIGEGKVGEALIRQAGSDLLVVGSRGITTMAWVLLGSAANRVAGRALGPVLVVRDKTAPAQGLLERLVRR